MKYKTNSDIAKYTGLIVKLRSQLSAPSNTTTHNTCMSFTLKIFDVCWTVRHCDNWRIRTSFTLTLTLPSLQKETTNVVINIIVVSSWWWA